MQETFDDADKGKNQRDGKVRDAMNDIAMKIEHEINKKLTPSTANGIIARANVFAIGTPEHSLYGKNITHSVRDLGRMNNKDYYNVAFGVLGSLTDEGFENYPAPYLWCEYQIAVQDNGVYSVKPTNFVKDDAVSYPYNLSKGEFTWATEAILRDAVRETDLGKEARFAEKDIRKVSGEER